MKLTLIPYQPVDDPELQSITKDVFLEKAARKFSEIAERQFMTEWRTDSANAQTVYRQFLEKALELECESEFNAIIHEIEANATGEETNVRFWALPKPLYHEANNYNFPLHCLPNILKEYVEAVSKFGQVPVEMCALPLLSVLALCCQGKCKVSNHNSSFTYELTLYTLTVAPSGARKTPALSYFMKAVYDFQNRFNEAHEIEFKQNESERLFLENQRQKAMKGSKGDPASLEKVKEFDKQLVELPKQRRLSLSITDVTPEALAQAMQINDGKMAIMDSEGGALGTAAGLYNGGVSNIDLLLKAYDGEFVEIWRKTSETVELKRPLLTIGLLTQPKKFNEFITNNEFEEKGLLNRFLFAFPTAPKRYTDTVPEIPKEASENYNNLIKRLLSMAKTDTIIIHDKESKILFHELHEQIQDYKQSGGIFEHIPNYAEKQMANAIKIAALLHLCEHSPQEPISGDTALKATQISMWAFNQAVKAFDGDINENATILTANKIIDKMYSGHQVLYSIRELYTALHLKKDDPVFNEALEMLTECYYIQSNGKNFDERGCKLRLNPIIKPTK